MNKDLLRKAGFGDRVEKYEQGNCTVCNKTIHPNNEFKDYLSLKEYTITGLCQTCQDEYFEPDPPGGYGVCRDTGTLSQEDIDGWE